MMHKPAIGFRHLEKCGGEFIPFNHKVVQEAWARRFPKEPFTGACAGTVAAVVEIIVKSSPSNLKEGHLREAVPFISRESCAVNQWRYEHTTDRENFLNAFIRDVLKSQNIPMDYPNESFCYSPDDLMEKIKPGKFNQTNQILLINLIFDVFNPANKQTTQQDHMIAFVKYNSLYICCDPQNGIALFNSEDRFKSWLDKEMTDGAFAYFTQPVLKTIAQASHKIEEHGKLLKGFLKINSAKTYDYTFGQPQPRIMARSQL